MTEPAFRPNVGARIAVADAGPLIHLDELDCLGLLTDFIEVRVPVAVWREVEQDFDRGGLGLSLAHYYGFDGSEWHPGALAVARAEAIIAATPTGGFTPADHCRLAYVRATIKLWTLGDPVGAKQVLDEATQYAVTPEARGWIDSLVGV